MQVYAIIGCFTLSHEGMGCHPNLCKMILCAVVRAALLCVCIFLVHPLLSTLPLPPCLIHVFSHVLPQRNYSIPDDVEVSEEAIDLLKNLICSADKRLGRSGISDFKKHPFFKSIDWDNVHKQDPPYVPTIHGSSDTSNFEDFEPARTGVSNG